MTRQGNNDRAAALATWSLQKRDPVPEDPWMTALLTECYDGQRLALKFEEYFFSGQMAEAVPLLDRVAELDPKGWLPPLIRGWSLAQAHQDAEAVKEYRNALDRGGDPEKLVPLMVTSLLALNQATDAVAFASDYYGKKPQSQPILLAYSDAVTRQGDDSKTRVLLEKLLEKETLPIRAKFEFSENPLGRRRTRRSRQVPAPNCASVSQRRRVARLAGAVLY